MRVSLRACVPLALTLATQALDELVCQHLAADFRARYGIDALSQPRAAVRLRQASEKVRRVLSANREGHVSLDCLVVPHRPARTADMPLAGSNG